MQRIAQKKLAGVQVRLRKPRSERVRTAQLRAARKHWCLFPLPTPVRERRPLSFCARPCSRSPSSGPSRSLPSSLHGSVASSLKMSSSPSSVRFGEVEKLSVLPSRLCVSSSSREMQTHRSRQGLFPPAVQTGGASPAASQDAVSSLCLSSSLSSAVASPVSPTFENASGDSFSSLGFSGPLSPLHSPAEEETTAALPAVAVREESCFSEEAKKFSERRESTRVQEQQQEQRDTRAEETTGDREGEGDVVVQERETEHLSEAEVHPFPRNSSDTALFLSSSLDSEKTGDSSASPREALLRRLQGHLRFLSSFSTTQQLPPCSALWNAKTKHAERRTSSTTRMNSSERTSKDSSKLQTRQSTPEYAQTKKTHLRQPSARSTTSRHPSLPSSHPSSSSLPSSHPSSSSRQSTSLPSSRRSRPSSVKRSPGGQSTLRDRGSAACPPQRSVKASSLRCPCISPRRRLQMSAASKKLRGEEEWRREAGTERNMEETKRDTGERKPLTGREEGREGQDVREGKNGTERGESGVDTALKGLAEKEEANKVGGTKSSVLDELESEIEKGVFKADLVIAATTEEQGEEGAEQKDGCFKDTEEARAQSSTASSLARQQKKTQPAQRREEEREREGEKEREGRAAASTGKGRWSVSGGGMDGPREATKLTMEQEKNAKLLEDLCVKFTAHKLLQMRRSRAVAFSREGSEGENRPADLLSRAARTSRGDMRSTTNEEKERGDKENGTSGVTEEAQEDEEVKGRFTETCSSIRLHPSSTSQQPRKTRGSVACSLSSSRSCSLSRSVRSAGSFSDQQTELPTLLSRICGPSLKKADAARKANTKTGQSAKRYEEESAQTAEERLPGQGVGTICPSSVRSTKRIDETPFSASPTSRVSLPASEKSDCRLPSSPYSPEKRPLSSRSRRRHVILLTPLPSSSPLASPFLSASTSSSAFPSSSSSAFPSSSSSSAFPSSSSSALPSSSSSAFPSSSSAFPSSSSSAFPSSSSSAFPSSSSSAFPSSSSSAFPSSSSSAFPSSTRRATRRECTDARRSFRRGEGEADFEKMRETSAARRERREDGARLTDLRGKEGAFTASQDKNRTRKSREPSANAGAASHLHGEQSSRLLHCPKTLQPRSSSSSPRDGTPSLHKGKTEGFVSPRTRPCSSLPLHSHLPVASCSRCSSQPFQPSCLPVYSASPSPLPSFVHLSSLLYAPPPSSHLPASSPQLSSALPSSSSRPSSLPFFPQAFAPAGCTPVFLGSSERPVSRPLASSLCRPAERGSASHDREAKESRRFLHLAEAEKESSRLRPPERAEEARGQGRFEQSGRWEASCPSLSLQRRGRRKETPRGREETTQLMLRVLDSREEGLRLRTQQEFDRLPRIHAAASPEQRRRRELGERGREVEAADPPPRRNISEQFTKQERRTRQVNLQERAGTETLERRRVNKGETTPTPFSDFSAPPELWDVALRVSPPSFPSSPFFSLSFPSSPFFSFPSLRSCGKVLQTARGQAGSCESLRSLSAADGVENEQESREKTGDM